ncbi:hypothetical protein [Pelagibacterium montanilacus]|uniref:hypothetical protein n=1 Tax=Pelagibacterium montanilacus TaxID=2185280 RepID=UPI000F8E67E3|nr:hypothetical protein [Pelagibacterium montanilacus]
MAVVVQVIGVSGAGKTTLIDQLEARFSGRSARIKNTGAPVPRWRLLLDATRHPRLWIRLLSGSDLASRTPGGRRKLLSKLAYSLALPVRRIRALFPAADVILVDELGGAGSMSLVAHSRKRADQPDPEPAFALALEAFGQPDVLIHISISPQALLARRLARGRSADLRWSKSYVHSRVARKDDLNRAFVNWLRKTHPEICVLDVGEDPDISALVETIAAHDGFEGAHDESVALPIAAQ